MDSDQHELAIERLDDLRALERDRIVGQQIIETRGRRARRRLHPIARRVGPQLVRLRLLLAERELHAHLHPLRALRRPHLEILEHDHPPLGALGDRFFLQRLDRPHVRGLRHADLAMIDLEAELRHQRRFDVAHDLLGLDAGPREHMHLAHLAERRHHHPRRQHAGQRRDEVFDPLHAPRIGLTDASPPSPFRWTQRLRLLWRRIGCHSDGSSPDVATRFRPPALARYSARSAATSTSSSFFAELYSATPMLAVTSPGG